MPPRTNRNNARSAHARKHEPNSEQISNRISEHLDALERLLDDPNPKRNFDKLALRTWGTQILPEHQSRLEQLTRRVWASAGTGRHAFEEDLLRIHIVNAGAAALPLLRDAISFTKERDKLSPDRKRWAMMGIAVIAWQLKDLAALDYLSSLLAHDDLRVRTWAVEFVGATHVTAAGKLNDECVKALELVAKNDSAFEPRFRARDILTAAGHPTPMGPPGGVYAFKASFGGASRTIEAKAEQTMNELAWAIVKSFGWDTDHLFQFYLSKKLDTPAFKTPREDELEDLVADEFDFVMPGEEDDDDSSEEESKPMVIGFPGFTVGHEFTFLYDFGDSNEFNVRVVDIRERADLRVKYPRVVAKEGKAPPQYRGWE